MTSLTCKALLLAGALITLGSCNKSNVPASNAEAPAASAMPASNDPVASAESAAPASIAHDAAIVTMDDKGNMTTVREGKNGWTCVPDNPVSPGPDPMCADANAVKWIDALIHHNPPPAGAVGIMYMLEGGTDASNTDPYAQKPTADNNWIKTPPHVMVVGSKEILAGHPATPNPDTSVPYVMFPRTLYAHLMVPLK